MTGKSERAALLRRKPETLWEGEPRLGSAYGGEEIAASAVIERVETLRGEQPAKGVRPWSPSGKEPIKVSANFWAICAICWRGGNVCAA